jgi:hypothetical protein
MISYNLPDPTEQEKIRRGPHEYLGDTGTHGRYVRKAYVYQEYPKVMDKTPYPQLRDFAGKFDAEILLEHARKQWDQRQIESTVKSKSEENDWLQRHAHDPILTPGAYPKTMDHTPAPRADQCAGVDDYRQKRQAWRDQIAASIVHDEVEEQLWLEEHPLPTRSNLEQVTVAKAPKGRKRAAESTAATA